MENLAILYFSALVIFTVTSAWVIIKNLRENKLRGGVHKHVHNGLTRSLKSH